MTYVFASRQKSSEGKHTSDFCGLTSLLLPKKKRKREKKRDKNRKLDQLGDDEREGVSFRTGP